MATPAFLISGDGHRVAYDTQRCGAPAAVTAICVPGLGDTRGEYRFLREALLKAGCDVITMDLRGFGGSDVLADAAALTPHGTGADVVALVRELALPRVVLMGCSMSAASVVYAAAELGPQVVAGVVTFGAFAWDHPMPLFMPTILWLALQWWAGGASTWARCVLVFSSCGTQSTSCHPHAPCSFYRSLYTLKPSPVPDLDSYCTALKAHVSDASRLRVLRAHMFASKATCAARIKEVQHAKIPVLACYGTKDSDFSDVPAEAAAFQARFGASTTTALIAGAGHYPHVESVAEVMSHLQPFLQRVGVGLGTLSPPAS